MVTFKTDKTFALDLDRRDPLAHYRDRFHLPQSKEGHPCLYFCGNSLGLQPKTAAEYINQELQDWADLGVEGHFSARHPWLPYHEYLTEQTARLVGALPSEVVVMNTLTVNLHLMLVSFYRPTVTRHKILMEANAFPSDQYAVQSQIRYHGYDPATAIVEIPLRPDEPCLKTEEIEDLIAQEGDAIALILLGGVNYYTGQAFDLERIVRTGHEKKCVVGFDLAHAVGNLVLHLHDWQVDFAVWCSYKYLNGGPGCMAGCFVHEKYAHRQDLPRFAGWWGHDKDTRFLMRPDYHAIPGAEGWQLSNPPILSLAALRASMDIFDEATLPALRVKSENLTGYLEFLLKQQCSDFVTILTPDDKSQRGCQLSLSIVKQGKQLHQRLEAHNIRCDWREPDVIRIAPVPLYNRFQEVYDFVQILIQEYRLLTH
ncbi:MAG: kynureninase [bacterium]